MPNKGLNKLSNTSFNNLLFGQITLFFNASLDELFDILKRNFGLVNKFDSKMSILFVEIDPAEKIKAEICA